MSELLYCIESIEDFKKQEIKILEEEVKSGKHDDIIIRLAKFSLIGFVAFISSCKTGRAIGDEGYDGRSISIDVDTVNNLFGKYSYVFNELTSCDEAYPDEELGIQLKLYNETVLYNLIIESEEHYDDYNYATIYRANAKFKCLVPYFEKLFKDNFVDIFKTALDEHGYFRMIAMDYEYKDIFDKLIDKVIDEENLDITLEEVFDKGYADMKLKIIDKYIEQEVEL